MAEGGGSGEEEDVGLPFVELDINDIDFYERCGSGAFGSVYRALWKQQNRIVAVKKLLVLEKEAQVLSTVSHKNIVKFYGAVTTSPNYCIITEFANEGCLYNFLAQKENNSMLGFQQILDWSIDIASGMHYLHREAPIKVIHRDLKSKNVVITKDFICKICDFGASRFHGGTTKMSLVGTLPWMAPEVIQCLPVSDSCDVWSFGVVLWELLTHEMPFKGIEGFQVAWAVVEKDERLTIPSSCPKKFSDLMNSCWKKDPKERMSFDQILNQLQHMKNDDTLCDQASLYLSQKSVWRQEIEATLELMKRAEQDLSQKQKQLEEWEDRLAEREHRLQSQQLCSQLYEHDVKSWSENDVHLWVKQMGSSGSNSTDLEQYADLFLKQRITGHRLLLLTPDDFKEMGIVPIGHRIHLMDEIEKLQIHNRRLLHFPALQQMAASEGYESIGSSSPSELRLVLLFGSHVRLGAAATDHKWKMFVEVDLDDSEGQSALAAVTCIRDVSFECQAASLPFTKISQPPYVMDRWLTGIGQDTLVTCIVTYEDTVKKPRFTRLEHLVSQEGGAGSQQKEMTVTLQMAKQSSTRFVAAAPQSAPILPDAWRNRFVPGGFSFTGTTPGNYFFSNREAPSLRLHSSPNAESFQTWAKVASGEVSPHRQGRLPRLESPSCFLRKFRQVAFDDDAEEDGESRQRRSSAPTHRPHHRRKYRHSTSDSGFSSADSPPVPRMVKVQRCRIRMQDTQTRREGSPSGDDETLRLAQRLRQMRANLGRDPFATLRQFDT